MGNAISGHCLCGNFAYEYLGEVGPANYCHCEDCRRCTGSAFNIGVRLDAAKFRIISGDPKGFTKLGESGNELTRHFCPECGSPLFTSSPRHPECVYVKAGSLDDPTIVRPDYQSWTASAVSWNRIDPELASYRRGRT
jgi:hypothetical protein